MSTLPRLFAGRTTVQRVVTPVIVVEISKAKKLVLQVARSPKEHKIEILSSDRTNDSLDERMRNRQVGYRLHFGNLEYSKVRFPPMESEQWIMIAADIFWRSGSADRAVEHPTE